MSTIVLDVTDQIARITIDRPERMNAFDIDTHEAFAAAIDRVEADDDIHVAVITGAGNRSFRAGRDLKWTAEISRASAEVRADADRRMAALTRLQFRFDITKPLIARLNGVALGGGLELAMDALHVSLADAATYVSPAEHAWRAGTDRIEGPRAFSEKRTPNWA